MASSPIEAYCPDCKRSFSQKGNYKRHLETTKAHNEVYKYPCSRCLTPISTEWNLQEHMKKGCKGPTAAALLDGEHTRIFVPSHFQDPCSYPVSIASASSDSRSNENESHAQGMRDASGMVSASGGLAYTQEELVRRICINDTLTVQRLLNSPSINPDHPDQDKKTPLRWAAEYGHDTIVGLLLATRRVNVHLQANDGCSPLYIAADKRHLGVVIRLLDTGLYTWEKDGKRAWSAANRRGHLEVEEELFRRLYKGQGYRGGCLFGSL